VPVDRDSRLLLPPSSHVQVFAPSPLSTSPGSSAFPTSSDEDERPLNGYDLLTEVSSGGTLSSLFTILSLFTEDVRLSWDPPKPTGQTGPSQPATSSSTPRRRKAHRANSDVSAFDLMRGDDLNGDQSGSADGASTLGSESVGTATPGFNGADAYDDDRSATGGEGGFSRSSSYQGYRTEPDTAPKFTGGGGSGEERGTVARATGEHPVSNFVRLTSRSADRPPVSAQSTRRSRSSLPMPSDG
jgi:lysophospholipid hydrolase